MKSADDPHLDKVVKTHKYLINDSEIVNTTNTYLNKKLDKKTHEFGTKTVKKDFDYTNNKVNSETNSIFGISKTTTYTYDTFDRLSSITSNGKTITYKYDDFGRLVRENNESLYKTIVYEYNDIGNSTSSVGVGLNAYVSSNIGIGSSLQL